MLNKIRIAVIFLSIFVGTKVLAGDGGEAGGSGNTGGTTKSSCHADTSEFSQN